MRDATIVLSDSGGIQEEAPALGVPLPMLGEKTGRPEGVAAKSSQLVGTGTRRIVEEVESLPGDQAALAQMSRRAFPFGDGRSAVPIASIIARWLDERSLTQRLA